VLKRYRFEPVYADRYVLRVIATRQLQFFASRCAGADEHCIEFAAVEQCFHALNAVIHFQVGTHIDYVADFFVQDVRGQAKLRNIGSHQATGFAQCFENRDVITQWQQIIRHSERGTTRADECNLLAVLVLRRPRKSLADVVAMVCSDSFQAADGDGFVFDPPAPAGRLTGPVTHTAKNAGKYIGFPIEHVGVSELALCDQADIARNVRMRGTRPLAVDDLVKVFRIGSIGWLHLRGARTSLSLSGDWRSPPLPHEPRRIAGSTGK